MRSKEQKKTNEILRMIAYWQNLYDVRNFIVEAVVLHGLQKNERY